MCVLIGIKRAGTASASLVGRLLDDHESTGVVDPDHEYDIKMVGAAMYSGKYSHQRYPDNMY